MAPQPVLLEVSGSESASVSVLARYQDTMFQIVPSKKAWEYEVVLGKSPALEDALTDCLSILSHWHKCNRVKPFILAGKLDASQWKMTNAFYIQTYVSFGTIYRLGCRTTYMFAA